MLNLKETFQTWGHLKTTSMFDIIGMSLYKYEGHLSGMHKGRQTEGDTKLLKSSERWWWGERTGMRRLKARMKRQIQEKYRKKIYLFIYF